VIHTLVDFRLLNCFVFNDHKIANHAIIGFYQFVRLGSELLLYRIIRRPFRVGLFFQKFLECFHVTFPALLVYVSGDSSTDALVQVQVQVQIQVTFH
jgi:hypothetical protein